MSGSLFTAWRPDAAGREQLDDLVARLARACPPTSGLQLRRPDQWHVTLCYAGQGVADRVTPALLQALADAGGRVPPHAFAIGTLAYWPGAGAIVALPRHNRELQALCNATREALAGGGFPALQATTQPHVTLAYADRQLPAPAWLANVGCAGAPLAVEGFELLRSAGGRYQTLGAWPLRGAPLPPEPEQAALF